jgi:hypothetical protein
MKTVELVKLNNQKNKRDLNLFCLWFFNLLFISSFVFQTNKSQAAELFQTHHSARAYGMGGAYIPIIEDEEALFFNPAGISRNGGIFWTVADPGVGISGVEALDSLTGLQGSSTDFAAALNDLYGKPVWIGGSAKSSVMLPFFAAAYFYDVDISFIAQNPSSPTLETNYITDTGYAIGTGFSMAGIFEMGFAARYITRTGDRITFGAADIATIVGGGSTDVIFDEFEKTGTGYAFDMGMNLTIPSPVKPTFSFVWKNIGNTSFRADAGEPKPPTIPQEMSIGAALGVHLPFVHLIPVLEYRFLNDSEMDLGQKLHLGVELGLPLIDLRAGLYQGYFSYGVGLDLGFISIDLANWSSELGGYAGQFESNRYMLQLALRIGLDLGLGGGGSSKDGSTSTSSRSGSSKGSIFGRKRPKMRR